MDDIFLGEKIYHLAIEMNKVIDREFESTGLHYGQIQILLHLYDLSQRGRVPVHQEKLTKQMYTDKSNVSRNLRKLALAGYIRIETDYTDNRNRKIIYFTAESEEKMEHCFMVLSGMLRLMTKGISEECLGTTEQTLQLLIHNLSQEDKTDESITRERTESGE